jgi:Zn-dependent M28 family amino/carboxypeptidase
VIGILPGSDPRRKKEVVLLSAHLDHLGRAPEEAVAGDAIFNGADDDASGCAAVLELARALASGRRPRRTVVFAFFGSEELGGFGDRYFLEHPPVPLDSIIANLEFEMIGRPDAALPPHTLWLTGWERSTLGPALAKHGARLVGDPHPKEKFFRRSDNYALARKGIVAQTVSSFGLHTDYHQPSDDLAHLDLAHMADAIGSMIRPVRWLANSGFKPQWAPGGRPPEAGAQPATQPAASH